MAFTFFKEIAARVFWTVFSVYMTEYIYISIERKTPFKVFVAVIGVLCLGHVCIHIIAAFQHYFIKYLAPDMYRSFYKRVIDKSISMEYVQFEKPDFYDKYTRALSECQWRGMNILQFPVCRDEYLAGKE